MRGDAWRLVDDELADNGSALGQLVDPALPIRAAEDSVREPDDLAVPIWRVLGCTFAGGGDGLELGGWEAKSLAPSADVELVGSALLHVACTGQHRA